MRLYIQIHIYTDAGTDNHILTDLHKVRQAGRHQIQMDKIQTSERHKGTYTYIKTGMQKDRQTEWMAAIQSNRGRYRETYIHPI